MRQMFVLVALCGVVGVRLVSSGNNGNSDRIYEAINCLRRFKLHLCTIFLMSRTIESKCDNDCLFLAS